MLDNLSALVQLDFVLHRTEVQGNTMKASTIIFLCLAAVLTIQTVSAQYPGEYCHWQCDVIYCDYYHDYCDYDCYEVCYPYSPFRTQTLGTIKTTGQTVQRPKDGKSHINISWKHLHIH